MSALEATYTSVLAKINSDTASGGLRESSVDGAAYIYAAYRAGDENRTTSWPFIIVQITEDDDSSMSDSDTCRVGITFLIEVDRDAANSFTKQNAVEARLRVLLRRFVLASQTINLRTWAFSPMERLGSGQGVPGGKANQLACQYSAMVKGTV